MAVDETLPATREGVTGSELASQSALLASLRYEKGAVIASGGSGRIVAARDLVFDRAVAIKEPLDPARDGLRFHAEAELLASLEHPSIVPIYDVGVWTDGVPFFAMKLVEGRSLRDVLHDATTLADRLALVPQLVAIGDAIAYAHARGVIHRDLKPGNVLVGRYGETVVIDWGLAVRLREPGHAARGIAGTPAYMAPEQARGEALDERTDVYALGAILYQVLAGRAPFDGLGNDELIAQLAARPPAPIEELQPRAPSDLIAIANKAMARDPGRRYPTAAELVADLRRFATGRLVAARRYSLVARSRRWLGRHRAVIGSAFVAAAVAIVAAIAVVPARAESAVEVCERSGDRIREAWDRKLQTQPIAVRLAFVGMGWRGGDLYTRVVTALDRYTGAWRDQRVDACEATRVRGVQSDALLDLRMACLDHRLQDLDAVVHELESRRAGVLDKAADAVAKLPPLAACADTASLRAIVPPPADPVTAAQVEGLRRTLAAARARGDMGGYAEALASVSAAAGPTEALGYRPLVAELLQLRGSLESLLEQPAASEKSFRAALLAAADAHDDALAARIWSQLVMLTATSLGHPDEALTLVPTAELAVRRAGNDPDAMILLWSQLAIALAEKGKLEEARGYYERVMHLSEQRYKEEDPAVPRALVNYAIVLIKLNRNAEAVPLLERGLAIFQRTLGPDHPKVASTLLNLGSAHLNLGRYAEALTAYDRARAIQERALGADSPEVGLVLTNIGIAQSDLGDDAAAIADFDRAATIFIRRFGPEHPVVAAVIQRRGIARSNTGDLAGARKDLEHAGALEEKALGRDHPELAVTWLNLGELAARERDYVKGKQLVDRAEQIWIAAQGKAYPERPLLLVIRAELELAQDHAAAALPSAKEAVAILAARTDDVQLARARYDLSRAMWATPADRASARQLAERARDDFHRLGADKSPPAVELAAWLAAHRIP